MLLCVVGVLCLLRAQPQPEQKQLTVYTSQNVYSVHVVDRDAKEYVALADVLDRLGRVRASADKKKWKLRFNNREAKFTLGKTRARIHKQDIELSAPPLIENGRGLVPLHTLVTILNQLLPDRAVDLHEQSRRLFLDKAEVRYSAELRKAPPSQLVLRFTEPVNPSIATDGGTLQMVFRHEPIQATTGLEALRFDDRLITSLFWGEANGVAALTISGTAPLSPLISADRKMITISAVQRPPQPLVPPPPPPVANVTPTQPASAPAPSFVVVIDPAHGGDDHGGAITGKLAEKDATLAIARNLYRELDSRGIAVHLVRDGDATIPPDQRAVMANASTPSLYIAVHASATGNGVRVFTSRLKPAPRASGFLPWNTAQSVYAAASQETATAMVTELLKHDVAGISLTTSLRPLSNVASPAVAIEVAPPLNGNDLMSLQYEQTICSSIATAVANSRARLPQGGVAR